MKTVMMLVIKQNYLLALDIEDDGRGNPKIFSLYGEYQTPRGSVIKVDIKTKNIETIVEILLKKVKNSWLGGYNMGYDLALIYPQYPRAWDTFKGKFSGFKVNKAQFRAIDLSGKWFQGISLKELCEKFEIKGYIDEHFLYQKNIIEACRSHAKCTYDVIKKVDALLSDLGSDKVLRDYLTTLGINSTAMHYTVFHSRRYMPTVSGLAYKIWKEMEKQNDQMWDKGLNIEASDSYHGGRCEVFKSCFIKKAYYYDVASMYPSVMKNYNYPNPNKKFQAGMLDNLEYYLKEKAGFATGTIFVPNMLIPPLAVVYNKKLLFPTGTWTGSLTFPEISYLLELGGTFIPQSIAYTEKWQPFNEYVTLWYAIKSYKNSVGVYPYKELAKLFLNGLSGKFAQKSRPEGEFVRVRHSELDLIKTGEFGQKTFYNIAGTFYYQKLPIEDLEYPYYTLMSAYITAYSRIKLHRVMNEVGYEHVVYTDTDSIITDTPIPEKYITNNKELGLFECETEGTGFQAISPKKYRMVKKIKQKETGILKFQRIFKANGIPKRCQEEFWKDPLSPILYSRPLSLKEAIRRKLKPSEWVDIIKIHVPEYKRVFSSDGNSIAIQIDDVESE